MKSENSDSEFEDSILKSENLDSEFRNLDLKSAEDSDTSLENHSYQSQFLSKDRADRFQNLSESAKPVKLFQLFFTVKEIKNIVKQTNQWAAYMIFKSFWILITVTEIYHYLEYLIYMRVQSLHKLENYWYLKTFVASCLSQKCFKQIWHAFIIQDSYMSSQQSEESWWFRVKSLTTTIHKVCQKY